MSTEEEKERRRIFVRHCLDAGLEKKVTIMDALEIGPEILAVELERSLKRSCPKDKLRVKVVKLDLFEVELALIHVDTMNVLPVTWGGIQYAGRSLKSPVLVRGKRYTTVEQVAAERDLWLQECRQQMEARQDPEEPTA